MDGVGGLVEIRASHQIFLEMPTKTLLWGALLKGGGWRIFSLERPFEIYFFPGEGPSIFFLNFLHPRPQVINGHPLAVPHKADVKSL